MAARSETGGGIAPLPGARSRKVIEQVCYRNFKTLRDVKLTLGRLTVLVGPNGCGKTSALDGLYFLSLLRDAPPEEVFKGRRAADVLRSRVPENDLGTQEIALAVSGQRGGEFFEFMLDEVRAQRGFEFTYTGEEKDHRKLLPRVRRLRLDPDVLAEPVVNGSLQMDDDGRGLANVLTDLSLTDRPRFEQIESLLHQVVPSARRLGFRKVEVEVPPPRGVPTVGVGPKTATTYELLFDTTSGTKIPAHAASEGTLLALGLLTAATGAQPLDALLIDDIERGIHPAAFRALVQGLRAVLKAVPDLQLLVTSHSPYLLESFEPEEVRLMRLDETGYAKCDPMPDHPDFAQWQDVMTTGELWSVLDDGGFASGGDG